MRKNNHALRALAAAFITALVLGLGVMQQSQVSAAPSAFTAGLNSLEAQAAGLPLAMPLARMGARVRPHLRVMTRSVSLTGEFAV